MIISILHLSDMHFNSETNSVLQKKEKIIGVLRSIECETTHLFVVISGDIAISGKRAQYDKATEFLDHIKDSVESDLNTKISYIIVAGNHDCHYGTNKQKSRDLLIEQVKQKGADAIDEGVIHQCCEVQDDYFNFVQRYEDEGQRSFSERLLSIYEYDINDYRLVFKCYNTSWMSQRDEQPGSMYYPLELYCERIPKHRGDLIVSVLHHGCNWQNPDNSRELRTYLQDTSDFVLTGHEHIASKSRRNDLEGRYTVYIEGSVLQETDDDRMSEFNLILVDLHTSPKMQIHKYEWNGDMYSLSGTSRKWVELKRSESIRRRLFEINDQFNERIQDPGAPYVHPHKEDLFLDDFFVYPDLSDLVEGKTGDDASRTGIKNSSILRELGEPVNRILLGGNELCGKSALCKKLFRDYYDGQYIPLLLAGHKIRSSSMEKFRRLIKKTYEEQYLAHSFEQYSQQRNDKKVIIIDDFDKSKLNTKHKLLLLRGIGECWPNIIITANSHFFFGQLTSEDVGDIYTNYKRYGILPFGHLLRSKLIHKWNALGQDQYIEANELLRKNDSAKRIIDTFVGRNYVPAFPFYLITILQLIETGTPHSSQASSYGFYYDELIRQALRETRLKHDEIDACYNYVAVLANHLFEKKRRWVSQSEIRQFHESYCGEYDISLEWSRWIEKLFKGKILIIEKDMYRFRYKYVYYYFVAQYMTNNLIKDGIRQKVSRMCQRLHIEEFANIIIFLTHLSKDPFILEEIVKNARSLFSDLTPIRFENDVLSINKLISELPRLVLENKDIKKSREERLRAQDEIELETEVTSETEDELEYDLDENVASLSIISKLNLAFKVIDIMGQIMRKHYGSLKGNDKVVLCEEAYFAGLRTLNALFSMIEDNKDSILDLMKSVVRDMRLTKNEKIESFARRWLFDLYLFISFIFIEMISRSVGSKTLSRTFEVVRGRYDMMSIHIIDVSIKLHFCEDFPYSDVAKLSKLLDRNFLPITLLRQMVKNYLYMYESTHQDRQRISNLLKISMATQRAISGTVSSRNAK